MSSFLIIQTASIGDVILATPVLEKLKYFHPESRIDLLIKKGTEGLFAGHPFINKLYIWNKNEKKYSNLFSILKVIQRNRYDYVINLQRFASSGILTVFSRARKTIGFNKNPFSVLFGKSYEHKIKDGDVHEVERNLSLIEDLSGEGFFMPKLYPTAADKALMSQYKTEKYICIAPASLWNTKQYPEDKWIEFVKTVDDSLRIYFLGSKNDQSLCERIIEQSGHANSLNLAGKFSLLQTAELMRDAFMNYTNDSAPTHLASAVNGKTTTIFCSTITAFGFGPLSDNSYVVETKEDLDCRPCGLHGFKECPENHLKCAYTISVEQLSNLI